MTSRQIHVAVAHRDPYVAAGIAALLRARDEFEVRTADDDGQAGNPGNSGVRERADVVVTDYASGLRKAESAAQGGGSFLVVTDRNTGWQIRRAVDAGIRGYLLHDCSAEELSSAVRCVAEGRRYIPCSVADQLLDSLAAAAPTARELDVLQLIAQGLGNKDIGRRLGIGEGTVKTHVKALLRKLGEPTRTAAIAEAFRRGLLLEAAS